MAGWLKHGNPPGDFSMARRCGARSKRTGHPCRGPAMRGKRRCRLHGGKSTGPRTPEGLARSRRARWKHGGYSAAELERFRRLQVEFRTFNAAGATRRAWVLAAMTQLEDLERKDLRNLKRRPPRRTGPARDAQWANGGKRQSGRPQGQETIETGSVPLKPEYVLQAVARLASFHIGELFDAAGHLKPAAELPEKA